MLYEVITHPERRARPGPRPSASELRPEVLVRDLVVEHDLAPLHPASERLRAAFGGGDLLLRELPVDLLAEDLDHVV